MCNFYEYESFIHLIIADGFVHAISGYERVYQRPDPILAPIGDTSADKWLLTGGPQGGFFRPEIWDDNSRLVPAPQGSVAATLLRNLAFAPQEHQIDTRLRADIDCRLGGISDFVSTQLADFEAALKRL